MRDYLERCAEVSALAPLQYGHFDPLRVAPAEQNSNKDVATKVGCSTRTVEVHATAVMRKCRVESRARLVSVFWSR